MKTQKLIWLDESSFAVVHIMILLSYVRYCPKLFQHFRHVFEWQGFHMKVLKITLQLEGLEYTQYDYIASHN